MPDLNIGGEVEPATATPFEEVAHAPSDRGTQVCRLLPFAAKVNTVAVLFSHRSTLK